MVWCILRLQILHGIRHQVVKVDSLPVSRFVRGERERGEGGRRGGEGRVRGGVSCMNSTPINPGIGSEPSIMLVQMQFLPMAFGDVAVVVWSFKNTFCKSASEFVELFGITKNSGSGVG